MLTFPIIHEVTSIHCTHNYRLFSNLTRPQRNNSLAPLLTHETSNRFSNNQKHKQRQPFSLQHQKYVKLLIIVQCDAIQPYSLGGLYLGLCEWYWLIGEETGGRYTTEYVCHEVQQSKKVIIILKVTKCFMLTQFILGSQWAFSKSLAMERM